VEGREARERKAYDEDRVFEESSKWHKRAQHVLRGPNTQRGEVLFDDLVRKSVTGGRALDICCGLGFQSVRLLELGANYVLGADLAESEIAQAKTRELPGRLEFRVADVSEPLDGKFDLIFGRSALHHIDFRPVLLHLFRENRPPPGFHGIQGNYAVTPNRPNPLERNGISRRQDEEQQEPVVQTDSSQVKTGCDEEGRDCPAQAEIGGSVQPDILDRLARPAQEPEEPDTIRLRWLKIRIRRQGGGHGFQGVLQRVGLTGDGLREYTHYEIRIGPLRQNPVFPVKDESVIPINEDIAQQQKCRDAGQQPPGTD